MQTFGVSWEVCIALEPGSKPSTLTIGLVPPAFAFFLEETQPKALPRGAWSFSGWVWAPHPPTLGPGAGHGSGASPWAPQITLRAEKT